METLFDSEWSLWGPGEAAAFGLLDNNGWISKPGEELLADGIKSEAGNEDLWAPLVDLVDDAEFNEWMEIKMDVEDLSEFSAILAPVEPFPPPTAPPPAVELLGPTEAELLECDITNNVTSEAAILFSSMLENTLPLSPTTSPSPVSDRPSSRSSSSAESSFDSTSSGPPSVAEPDLLSLWLSTTSTAPESSPESTCNAQRRPRKSSGRASLLRMKKLSGVGDKKVRKRDQNRDAATRYREKKRTEAEVLRVEEEKLEKKNHDLRDRADGLSAEIKYLKGLLKEMLEARQK